MTSHLPSLETLVHALENGIVSALDGDMFSHRQLEVYRRRLTRLAGLDECKEGPDACSCMSLFDARKVFLLLQEVNHVVLRDGSDHPKTCLEKKPDASVNGKHWERRRNETQCQSRILKEKEGGV
ncbi:hypothetical protein NPIL_426411 [Nephila pilipes]|uniref:Uncharacterized protein n=1 Tax=Nephila pilipes TaxID=299642 RepID=A0A8X6UCP5_NEPPI|nr:hypothetical protein NPIL_426411 [Nephila pilipes]